MKKLSSLDGATVVLDKELPKPKHAGKNWKFIPHDDLRGVCSDFITSELQGEPTGTEYNLSDDERKCVGFHFFTMPHKPTMPLWYSYEWFLAFVNLNDHRTPVLFYSGIRVNNEYDVVLGKVHGGTRHYCSPAQYKTKLAEKKDVFDLQNLVDEDQTLSSEAASGLIISLVKEKLLPPVKLQKLLRSDVIKDGIAVSDLLLKVGEVQNRKDLSSYLERLFSLKTYLGL